MKNEASLDKWKPFKTEIQHSLHRPGVEPGSPTWQASILPLNHRCCDAGSVWLIFNKPWNLYWISFYSEDTPGAAQPTRHAEDVVREWRTPHALLTIASWYSFCQPKDTTQSCTAWRTSWRRTEWKSPWTKKIPWIYATTGSGDKGAGNNIHHRRRGSDYDSPSHLEEVYKRKRDKYDSLGITLPLVIGSTGAWIESNDDIKALLWTAEASPWLNSSSSACQLQAIETESHARSLPSLWHECLN